MSSIRIRPSSRVPLKTATTNRRRRCKGGFGTSHLKNVFKSLLRRNDRGRPLPRKVTVGPLTRLVSKVKKTQNNQELRLLFPVEITDPLSKIKIMNNKSFVALIFASIFLTAAASGQTAKIAGVVRGSDGKPMKNADVRLE